MNFFTVFYLVHSNIEAQTDDVCVQTPSNLSSNTPRKQRQKRLIEAKNNKLRKVSKSKITQGKALNEALSKLPDNLSNFVKMQFKVHSSKKHGRRYSPEMKSLAISLYHASGKAYRLLAKLFILPSKSSLKNYISRLPTEAGISQETLNTIKQKFTHMSDMDKICTLCMDEMSLKTHLLYSVPKD